MSSVTMVTIVLTGTCLCGSSAFGQQLIHPQPTPFFSPRHTRGDCDFHGNGPHVDLEVELYVHQQRRNEIWARVYMKAEETKTNWTTVEEAKEFRVYRHRFPINRIVGNAKETHHYTDDDHSEDVFDNPPNKPLFRQLRYVGDTRGDEAGTKTGVKVFFNPIHIW